MPNLKSLSLPVTKIGKATQKVDKNSSGDEIANVNFYAVRPESYPNSLR